MLACSFSLKQEKKKKREDCQTGTIFSHTLFSLFASDYVFTLLPESGRALRRASGHWVPFPAEQTQGCTPRRAQLPALQAGPSAQRGKRQPVWCQAQDPPTAALFFPRWVQPMAEYLLSTDLPLTLARRAQREAHQEQIEMEQSLCKMLRVMTHPCNS